MLAFTRAGSGAPLLLLHGTNSSRRVWDPLLPLLTAHRDVLAVDLPGHGATPPGAATPPAFAAVVADWLDQLGLERVSIVGHSSGGWTALELAKLGRAQAVLALAPAGLWRRRSPRQTNAALIVSWRLGKLTPPALARLSLRTAAGRSLALHSVAAWPSRVPAELAQVLAEDAMRAGNFPEHFAQTKRIRFEGGQAIDPSVPVTVIWGDRDRIALAGKSRSTDELPAHALVATWVGCGHMMMWEAPERTLGAALSLP